MHSPRGDSLPEVKEEQPESHLPKVKGEEEDHPEDALPKVIEEGEERPAVAFPDVIEEEEAHPEDSSFPVKKESESTKSGSASPLGNSLDEPQGNHQAEEEEDDDDVQIIEKEDGQSHENASNQLVVYDPGMNGTGEIQPAPETTNYQRQRFPNYSPNPPSRVLPSVGAFTVQCANCFKWRLIPTKEKYEEIRESILQQPFVCDRAREWRPDITCEDPTDIDQDGSRIWAIDKPNIAQPPPGWQRLLRIRGEGSTKFADVYYAAPSGKRLRSMVEIRKYLLDHPEYMAAGVTLNQFSFQIPKPLQENYVRKRPSRVASAFNGAGMSMSRPLEPTDVNPLSWAGPIDNAELQNNEEGGTNNSHYESPPFQPRPHPAKKQRTKSLAKHKSTDDLGNNQDDNGVDESPTTSMNNAYDN